MTRRKIVTTNILQARLDKIDARIASGVESVSVDGTTTKINIESLRVERDLLERKIERNYRERPRRPRVSTVWLGGL